MKIGSLFSGAGGLDLAVENVFGATTVWHSEIDKAASRALAYRWPGVPNHGDISAIDWSTVEPIDILCGGWPCQPFSMAGKRKGIDDARALWPDVARAVRALRPRIVVLENVAAVLTAGEFDRVAADLAEAGYRFGWRCVRASDVGAPHRRERVFVVAADTGGGELQRRRVSGSVAETPSCGERSRHQRQRNGNAVIDSSADDVALLPTPRTSDTNGAGRHGAGGMDLRTTVTLLPTPQSHDGTAGAKSPQQIEKVGNSPANLIDVAQNCTDWGKYAAGIARWEQIVGNAPAPMKLNKNGKRSLNPAFSEWMMGWPNGWVTDPAIGLSRSQQLKIAGNGVVPQQAEAAISSLLQIVDGVNV